MAEEKNISIDLGTTNSALVGERHDARRDAGVKGAAR